MNSACKCSNLILTYRLINHCIHGMITITLVHTMINRQQREVIFTQYFTLYILFGLLYHWPCANYIASWAIGR